MSIVRVFGILDNLFGRDIFYILFYPLMFIGFILWIKLIKKINVIEFLKDKLKNPKFPEKNQRWAYYVVFISLIALLITFFIQLRLGFITYPIELPSFIYSKIHGIVGASIVEEIVFRGYFYDRCAEKFGKSRHFILWQRQTFDPQGRVNNNIFMTFEISYAALFSSLLFYVYHFNPMAFLTFIGGLIFCKFKREWNESLIPAMIFHGMWNGIMGLVQYDIFILISIYLVVIFIMLIIPNRESKNQL